MYLIVGTFLALLVAQVKATVSSDCQRLSTIIVPSFNMLETCCKPPNYTAQCSSEGITSVALNPATLTNNTFFWDVITSLEHLQSLYYDPDDLPLFPCAPPIPAAIGRLTNLTTLHLVRCGLDGSIPPEIGQLTRLTELNLHGNQLVGSIPESVGNLVDLVTLDIGINHLGGPVPLGIGNLTKLQSCYLNDNQLTALPHSIALLTNVMYFYVSNNQLEALPDEIGDMINLRIVDFSNNPYINHLPDMSRLESLFMLTLKNCKLNGTFPSWIPSMKHLDTLDLSGNSFDNIPEAIFTMTSLTYLDLSGNRYISQEIPASIGTMAQLAALILGNNNISLLPPEIGNLTKLESLKLNGNRLTELPKELYQLPLGLLSLSNNLLNQTLEPFWNMSRLSFLDVSNNFLHGKIPDAISEHRLELFNCSVNNLEGEVPSYLFANQGTVDLSYNKLRGNLSSFLQPITPQLPADFETQLFIFSGNDFFGEIPESICTYWTLVAIHASENNLTGSIPSCMFNLPNLHRLDLHSNRLDGTIPRIANATHLHYLRLDNNQLTGRLPDDLPPLLKTFDVSRNRLAGEIPQWNASMLGYAVQYSDTIEVQETLFT
ncbi:hypothetical protein HDV03_004630, partial [Kappamyces sp. JEL0829]